MRTIDFLIDKILILFIFLNVFAFDFYIGSIPLRYIVLGGLIFLTLLTSPNEFTNETLIRFVFTIVIISAILFLYSLLCGNKIENMISFLRPFSIFIIMPSLSHIIRLNGVDRYLYSFVLSVLLLIVFFAGLFIFYFVDPVNALIFSESQDLIMILNYNIIPRVVIKTFVFIVPAALYLFIKITGFKLYLLFVFFLFVSIISQTYALSIGVLFIFFIVLLKKKKARQLVINILSLFALYSFIMILIGDTISDMWAVKGDSVDFKSEQISNIAKDMDGFKILFGRGIGAEFINMDSRKITESVIEVAGVQLFQYGGLVFSWLILYIYMLVGIRDIWRDINDPRFFLSISQIGIFFVSMSNPYLWGGGMGLFFIVLLISYKGSLNWSYKKENG